MKAAVLVFPGSNREGDVAQAIELVTGRRPQMVWHGDGDFEKTDLIVLPGGFSYGDYLRCGAMAAQSPVMREVKERANKGALVLGICNGFQVLTEMGLLPGALMRNASLKFVCRDVLLKVENASSAFTRGYKAGQIVRIPVAHGDGNYFADGETLKRLEGESRIAFRYVDAKGKPIDGANPNGSLGNIAGILNDKGNVLGMMPHPERLSDPMLGGTDGRAVFEALAKAAA